MKTRYWFGVALILLLVWLLVSRQSPSTESVSSTTLNSVEPRAGAAAEGEVSSSASNGGREERNPSRFRADLSGRDRLTRRSFLTAASVLTGRTVDPSGEPVSGVLLELDGRAVGEVGEDRNHGRIRSGGDGEFRLDLPDSFGGWLHAAAEGYASVRQPIWSAGTGELHRVVVLTPTGGPLRVIVSEVFSSQRTARARVEASLMSPEPGDEMIHFECRTDESGECVLRDLPVNRRLRVVASKRGHFEGVKELALSGQALDLPLRLIRGPTLLLQVVAPDGTGLPGARVQRPDGMMGTTDATGRIWMPVIDEIITTEVTVSASGYRSQKATIANDGSPQKIVLDPAPVLNGVVFDTVGDPLPGVHVSLTKTRPQVRGRVAVNPIEAAMTPFEDPSELATERAVTDQHGLFEVNIPEIDGGLLKARRQGFLEWNRELSREQLVQSDYLEITLQPYASVVMGQTLDPSGIPIEAQVSFTLLGAANHPWKGPVSTTGGFYLVGDLAPGGYLVQAQAVSETPYTKIRYQSDDFRIEVADGTRLQLDLRLEVLEVVERP